MSSWSPPRAGASAVPTHVCQCRRMPRHWRPSARPCHNPAGQRAGEESMPAKPQVIALEEHYQDPDVVRAYAPEDARQAPVIAERLNDVAELRIKEMDAAGIDLQVLSHGNPGLQTMD